MYKIKPLYLFVLYVINNNKPTALKNYRELNN